MDFLKEGLVTTLKRTSSARSSRLLGGGYKPRSGRDVYFMYKDEFGFVAENPNHLITFAKQNNYILKYKNAEALLSDPPSAPKKKLPTGGYIWSDNEESSESLSEDEEKYEEKQTQSKRTFIALSSDYDQIKSPQMVKVQPLSQIPKLSQIYSNAISSSKNEQMINEDAIVLKDKSGYLIHPLTANIIIEFALDLSVKQWKKVSHNVLTGVYCFDL